MRDKLSNVRFKDIFITKNGQVFFIIADTIIGEFNFDYVLVCSSYYLEIIDFLLSKNVPESKIKLPLLS